MFAEHATYTLPSASKNRIRFSGNSVSSASSRQRQFARVRWCLRHH